MTSLRISGGLDCTPQSPNPAFNDLLVFIHRHKCIEISQKAPKYILQCEKLIREKALSMRSVMLLSTARHGVEKKPPDLVFNAGVQHLVKN